MMEEQKELIEPLFEKVRDYTQDSIELMKLKAIDKAADLSATVLSKLIVYVVFAVFFILLNIGISLWVGELLGKTYYGFLILAGVYLLIWALTLALKTEIKKKISDAIITKILHAD